MIYGEPGPRGRSQIDRDVPWVVGAFLRLDH